MEIPRSICREDALAPENTMVLRFILILAIFIFHAGIHMGFVTPDLGHVCVSVFFFLSGYGLEYSLDNKPGYAGNFLHRRVLGLMIQYWMIMTALALSVFLIHRSWDQFLFEFTDTFGVPLWYITELVAFYIVFYISTFIADRHRALVFQTAGTLFVMFVLWYHFNDDLYYRSGMCFVLGARARSPDHDPPASPERPFSLDTGGFRHHITLRSAFMHTDSRDDGSGHQERVDRPSCRCRGLGDPARRHIQ